MKTSHLSTIRKVKLFLVSNNRIYGYFLFGHYKQGGGIPHFQAI